MPATPPQELWNEVTCYDCAKPAPDAQMLRLAFLRRTLLVLVPSAAVDAQSLVTYGECYTCVRGITMADILELSLLDQIGQAV